MGISQRGQYALRALFELGKRQDEGPVSVAEIAKAQAIPTRFLELILCQLRDAGYVQSRRGVQGGHVLAVASEEVTVADVIRTIDGSLAPVKCMNGNGEQHCALWGRCVFLGLWQRAQQASEQVYQTTTLHDLIADEQATRQPKFVADYCI